MPHRLTRAQVPTDQTWDLDDLFPTTAAWEAAFGAVESSLPQIAQYKGRMGEGAAMLLGALTEWEQLMQRFMRVSSYSHLRAAEEGSSPANQAAAARSAGLGAKVNAAFSVIKSEILQLPDGTVEGYLDSESGLNSFRSTLEDLLETKPHRLQPETELALASLGEVLGSPGMIYNRAKSSDIQFDFFHNDAKQELTNSFALYENQYETSPSLIVRRNSYASFCKGLHGYQNTFAATLATEIKKQVVLARLRKYESATHMMLQPHKVDISVYNNVLDLLQQGLAPHMRRYAELRKRVLGLDRLLYCDIEAPLDPEFNPSISYAEASDLILEALSVLGPEYTQVMSRALKDRWVDLADNVGKSTGAFCASPYGVHPYILVTWADNMRGAFILAHELGHAGHLNLAMTNQRLVNSWPTMFFIEAPSTINELLLGQHILAKSNDQRMRRWVLMQFLATYHHNFVRHLLEGELLRRMYGMAEQGQPITATVLNQTKGEILSSYWGDAVEIDEGAHLTWMRQPHYYMGLYPYTYAAGLTASTAVAQLIREEGQPAVDRWLQVLKSGGTLKPLELMQMAGVDMSRPEPIHKAVAYVGSLVDELEKSF